VPQLFERTRVSEPAAFEASEEKTPAAASNSMVVTVSFENPHLLAPSHGPLDLVHVMACVDQLSGYYPAYNAIDTIGYNDRQLATAYRLLNSLSYGQIFHSIFGRGSSALRANELVYELLQSPLPPTQWVIEVSNWFAVSLSRLQHAIVEFASGPTSLPSEASVITGTRLAHNVQVSEGQRLGHPPELQHPSPRPNIRHRSHDHHSQLDVGTLYQFAPQEKEPRLPQKDTVDTGWQAAAAAHGVPVYRGWRVGGKGEGCPCYDTAG
jgi:hypothetical protein